MHTSQLITFFRCRKTGNLITELSTRKFVVDGHSIQEYAITEQNPAWHKQRVWELNEVEILNND